MTAPARKRLPALIAIAVALGIAVYATRPTEEAAPVATARPSPTPPPFIPPPPAPPPPPVLPPAAPRRGSIPGLSVNATFATRSGGGSILVTKGDGTRALVAVGSEIVPGTRLTGVAVDRATFTTGGTIFWIPIQSESAAKADPGPAALATAPSPPPAATATELRESQAYQAALAPSLDGPYRGYAIRGQTPLFAKAGLKPGDVITGINGRAFDSPAEIATLSREASLSTTLVFTIRRDGRSQELRVDP